MNKHYTHPVTSANYQDVISVLMGDNFDAQQNARVIVAIAERDGIDYVRAAMVYLAETDFDIVSVEEDADAEDADDDVVLALAQDLASAVEVALRK